MFPGRYKFCPEGTQPCSMKNRNIYWKRYKTQETRNIVHRAMTPQSPSKQAAWDLTQFSQLPSAALLYFPKSHWWSEISSLSKVILVLGKARSLRTWGWATWVTWCFAKRLHETWLMSGRVLWRSCQSAVAHSCGLLNHLNSFHGGIFKLNTKLDTDSLLYSLGHFECDSHTVHTLTQRCPSLPLTVQWVVIVRTGTFQSTLLSCQVTWMLSKLFSLY